MNCVIFGAGGWGTAMAIHLARQGQTVTLVPRRAEQALALATTRENKEYLPGHRLDDSIQIGLEPLPALMDADLVFLACPSKGLPELLKSIGPAVRGSSTKMAISLCKGLDLTTLRRPSEMMADAFGPIPVGTLSGPSNADEVARGLPTALVLAATSPTATSAEANPPPFAPIDVFALQWADNPVLSPDARSGGAQRRSVDLDPGADGRRLVQILRTGRDRPAGFFRDDREEQGRRICRLFQIQQRNDVLDRGLFEQGVRRERHRIDQEKRSRRRNQRSRISD